MQATQSEEERWRASDRSTGREWIDDKYLLAALEEVVQEMKRNRKRVIAALWRKARLTREAEEDQGDESLKCQSA